MRKKLPVFLLLSFLVLLSASSVFAAVEVEVFSATFTRGTGTPVTENRQILPYQGQAGNVIVRLYNGGMENTSTEMVSSSYVHLNGNVMFGPANFNQNVTSLQASGYLFDQDNFLDVKLLGKPGGKVTIKVFQLSDWTNVPASTSGWMKTQCGPWEDTTEGLKVYGSGPRIHNHIITRTLFDFVDREVYVKWKADGAGSFSQFGPGIVGVLDIADRFSMPNACCNAYTKAIQANTWYYTRIKINSNRTFEHVTATGDYDTNGGSVFFSEVESIPETQWPLVSKTNIFFRSGDQYMGTSSYFVVGEAKTNAVPVPINALNIVTYGFEDGQIPGGFVTSGNWSVAGIGYNSAKSVSAHFAGNEAPGVTLEVSNADAVSFKIKTVFEGLNVGAGFGVDELYGAVGWQYNASNSCWNEFYSGVPGAVSNTLKWMVSNPFGRSGYVYIDDIKLYYK